ncbi:MAG: NifU family protein [Bacteroidales bacterium]|nr:NifU family protein [Bacteroidales bacterium]
MDNSQNINLVKMALDKIRPYLQEDGGDIEFVELTDDFVLKVRYGESCQNCKFKEETKYVVEKHIRKFFPDLKAMVEV